jgi:23S rRNA-/tRNA-specific pseudouridylate synthase
VHLAHCGLPIIGDVSYGGQHASRIMLHCRAMAFTAADGREVRAEAPVDGTFNEVCRGYGIEIGPLAL